MYLQNHEFIQETILRLKEMHIKFQNNPQPYLLICGEMLDCITCYHAIIDTTVYDFNTILEATDFLFQFFEISKLNYPRFCVHLWSFIKDFVYELVDIKKGVVTNAIKLINQNLKLVGFKSGQNSNNMAETLKTSLTASETECSHAKKASFLSNTQSVSSESFLDTSSEILKFTEQATEMDSCPAINISISDQDSLGKIIPCEGILDLSYY